VSTSGHGPFTVEIRGEKGKWQTFAGGPEDRWTRSEDAILTIREDIGLGDLAVSVYPAAAWSDLTWMEKGKP
jgi:hypothetical protein